MPLLRSGIGTLFNLRAASRLAAAGLDTLFPPQCACCNGALSTSDDPLLCAECQAALFEAAGPLCPRCGASQADVLPEGACIHCRGVRFHFGRVVPLGAYRGELRVAVLRAKHGSQEHLAAALAELLWGRRGTDLAGLKPEVLVPVPMHWTRRLIRSANSPETVADVLSHRLRVPVFPKMLVRCRQTQLQRSLPAGRRADNVRGAFRLRSGYDCSGARVLLVDDILTTGATSNESARVLRKAGAAHVDVAVLARAVGID